ncbi:Metabotropic glutamate receptor 1 (mGluR1) [Durusdinium trenchii]|uniref:Metabotropic glutamate receptor 1 (MGluR1) n=1 Tax=Durusdinium trenchii TaxID=1381693 RepID=A0ABP0NRY3_9DINO
MLWSYFVARISSAIVVGALGGWTRFEPDVLVALIAADLDFRKHTEPVIREKYGTAIIDIPEMHENLSSVALWIGTTHANPLVGVATALDMMLGLDGHEPVVGLIGASTSSVSTPIATMSAVQKVPQISFSATSLTLSNKDLYPFFLRTLPPDSLQALALWSWIETFEVPSVTCIYTTEAYGEQLFDALKTLQQIEGPSVSLVGQPLPLEGRSAEDARRVARGAKEMGSRFLLLLTGAGMSGLILQAMLEEGMLGPEWQVLASDSLNFLRTSSLAEMPAGLMYFDFVARGPLFSKFQDLWSKLEAEDITGPEATERYRLDQMREALNHSKIAHVLADHWRSLSSYTGFAFDAYYAFLIAINQLLQGGVSPTSGDNLLQELRRTKFAGVSGQVSFDENGDRETSYELWNLQHAEASGSVGTVVAVVGGKFSVSSRNFSLYGNLTWMDGRRGRKPPRSLMECGPGSYNSGGRCQTCPKGMKCPGDSSTFLVCPRGMFANTTGSIDCRPCSPGFYAGFVGSEICHPCPRGFHAPEPNATECIPCAPGTYMPFLGGVACLPCGKKQQTGRSGATNESECECAEGFYMCEGEGCRACLEGLSCAAGLEPPMQKKGYWTQAPSAVHQCEFSVLQCRELECPAGPAGTCAPGREGLACNNCKKNHYPFYGGCKACTGRDFVPFILFMIVVVSVLLALSCGNRRKTNQESLNVLTAAAVTGQVLMAVQALGSLRELAFAWPEPVKSVIDLTRLMTFNFDIIRISCIYGSDDPILKFLSQLLFCPLGCVFFCLMGFCAKLRRQAKPLDLTVNRCGMLLFAFFLSITLRNLIPFQCVPNPDGSTSMDHALLVVLAIVGLLQPFFVLTWATYATCAFPSRLASGTGLRLVHRYRFLFHRFKPECFYYGLFLLYRNGVIALLPAVLVEVPQFQIPVTGIVLLASLVIQVRKYPWRTSEANYVELILTLFLLVILLGAAPLLEVDFDAPSSLLGWLLCVPVIGLFVPALLALWRAVWSRLKRQQKFGIFLCHHKGGAGSLCRLLKMKLARHSSTRVFLDCDQLENLDFLFDVVQTSTRTLVVVLTPELLRRVWCAGEIATAYKHKINTVPLVCEGFRVLNDDGLQVLPSLWSPEQKQVLANYGISLEDVNSSYRWLLHELSPLKMHRFGPAGDLSRETVWKRDVAAVELLVRCGLPMSATSAQILAAARRHNPRGARILITSCITDAEALSTCEVFQDMLQVQLQIEPGHRYAQECAVVQSSGQMVKWRPFAYYLVVLLFRGIFQDQRLMQILTSADGLEHVELPENDDGGRAFRRLLNVVALPFSPMASDGLQTKQVAEIAQRFRRYKDGTWVPSFTGCGVSL